MVERWDERLVAPRAVSTWELWEPQWRDGRVELPPVVFKPKPANWDQQGTELSDYGVKARFRNEYLAEVLGEKSVRRGLPPTLLPVNVVVRWDNPLSEHAVQIAAPEWFGGVPDERHLGWLVHRNIYWWGQTRIHDLARFSDHEMRAWMLWYPAKRQGSAAEGGWSEPEYGVLALPRDIARLSGAINRFIADAGDAPPMSTIVLPKVEYTDTVLHFARKFPASVPSARSLVAGTVAATPECPTLVAVRDGEGTLVGSWRDGVLVVVDERLRSVVSGWMASQGVDVLGSVEPGVKPLNLSGRWRVGCLEVVTPNPYELIPNGSERFAFLERWSVQRSEPALLGRVNLRDNVVWIQDLRLEPAVREYLTRVGVQVDEVRQAPYPWRLDETTVPGEVIPTEVAVAHVPSEAGFHLSATSIAALPEAVVTKMAPTAWSGSPDMWVDANPYRLVYAEHSRERRRLFPGSVMTGDDAVCRLCGVPTVSFAAPVSTEPLAYCQGCLQRAVEGTTTSREAAAAALRVIGDLEFNGEPMLDSQLATIHIDPEEPVAPNVIDRLVLCRMAVRPADHAWTLLLVESGLADEGVRMARGTVLPARDGHVCFSLREKVVDDFLHMHQIAHTREPLYPHDPVANPRTRLRADWRLDDGTLVEMWGLPNDPAYAAKMRTKERLASRHGIRLVGLLDEDLRNLPVVFADWLPHGVPTWRFSPQMITMKSSENTKSSSGWAGSALQVESSAMSNADARAGRIARASQALAMREAGYTRRAMAEELGVNIDSLGALLRDATFYANPSSDPDRLERARDARIAKEAGWTKAQYREKYGHSAARAQQGWQDAAVLEES